MVLRRPSAPVVAALGVAALAAVLTLVRLGTPGVLVFDEVHYVPDARGMLVDGIEPGFAVHPPLGKWVIAAGIAVVGDTPVGWRIGGALLAAVAVGSTVAMTRRLTGRTDAGVLAGLLLTLDGAWLVSARTAMLDVTLATAIVVGAHLLVVDRQRVTRADREAASTLGPTQPVAVAREGRARRYSDRSLSRSVAGRWPLLLAGVAFGVATATKWSGLFALGAAGLVTLVAEVRRVRHRRRSDGAGPVARAVTATVGALVAVPLAVQAIAYVPWLAAYPATATAARSDCAGLDVACDPHLPARLAGLGRYHAEVLRFHLELDADHPYRAPATRWPLLARPVVHFYESCDGAGRDRDGLRCTVAGPHQAAEVVALGNPALWWSALVLVPVAGTAVRRRDGAAAFLLVFLAAQFLPWLLALRPVFSFYAVPLVPFLAATVAVACVELDRPSRRGASAVAVLLAGGAAATVAVVAGGDGPTVVTTALVAATVGGVVGGHVDARRERILGIAASPRTGHGWAPGGMSGHGSAPGGMSGRGWAPGGMPIGTCAAALVAGSAVLLATYLAPLWYALPLDVEALRDRWWFPGWV